MVYIFRNLILCCLGLNILLFTGCSTTSFVIQNDIVQKTDQNFTNGFELKYTPEYKNAPDALKYVSERIPSFKLFDKDPTNVSRVKLSLEQNIFTPNDIKESEIIFNDLPYSGTLTGNVSNISTNENTRIEHELQIGTSGQPSLAGDLQKYIHGILPDNQRPNGWRHQITTEPLLNYNYNRLDEHGRIDDILASQSFSQVRLGNMYTDVLFQTGVKYGYNVPKVDRSNSENISIFLSADVFNTFRLQNIHFDGGVFRDSVHTVDKNVYVYGIINGIYLQYKNMFVGYAYTMRSRDFKEQQRDTHGYGGILLGIDW